MYWTKKRESTPINTVLWDQNIQDSIILIIPRIGTRVGWIELVHDLSLDSSALRVGWIEVVHDLSLDSRIELISAIAREFRATHIISLTRDAQCAHHSKIMLR